MEQLIGDSVSQSFILDIFIFFGGVLFVCMQALSFQTSTVCVCVCALFEFLLGFFSVHTFSVIVLWSHYNEPHLGRISRIRGDGKQRLF